MPLPAGAARRRRTHPLSWIDRYQWVSGGNHRVSGTQIGRKYARMVFLPSYGIARGKKNIASIFSSRKGPLNEKKNYGFIFSSHVGSHSREEHMRVRFFFPFADSILHRTQIADIKMGHPTGGWPIGNGLQIDCNGLADQTRSEASSVAPTPSRSTRIAWPSACETP